MILCLCFHIFNIKKQTLHFSCKIYSRRRNSKRYLDFLIKEIQTIGFKIKALYLDKKFFTIEVINYLQNKKTPFIIPCVKRGPSGEIRKLLNGKKLFYDTVQNYGDGFIFFEWKNEKINMKKCDSSFYEQKNITQWYLCWRYI